MRKPLLTGAGAVALAACALTAASATAGPTRAAAPKAAAHQMLLGIMDDAMLQGPTDTAFAELAELRPQVIRYDVDWPQIALRRPKAAASPSDPAYQFAKTDAVVTRAKALGIPVVLSIVHTPVWAGGTAKHNHAPKQLSDLRNFSYAVAARYDGHHKDSEGNLLPAVSRWTAWNEPNTTAHLAPQFTCVKGKGFFCKGGHFVEASPGLYAGILNAIYTGVHKAGTAGHLTETVAGGVTKPWGNGPTSSEPSMAPLKFLRLLALKKGKFDVWAQHPYRIPGLGNSPDNIVFETLPNLFKALDKAYPKKKYHVWLTEYGVQTNPPDPYQGVSLTSQASTLRTNTLKARANPRIDMLIWFLLNDEAIGKRSHAAGFQTGLAFTDGRHKPSWNVFKTLAHPAGTTTTASSK